MLWGRFAATVYGTRPGCDTAVTRYRQWAWHAAGVNITGLDNILLAIDNLDDARFFYGELLGLPQKFDLPEAGLVAYELPGIEPALIFRADEEGTTNPTRRTPRIWMVVPDARAACAELQDKGVIPLAEPFQTRTGWVFEVRDPSGNVIGFTDYTETD